MKMKNKFWLYPLVLMGFTLMLVIGCTKNDNGFPSNSSGTVTDIDGNIYQTVTIGTQTWMVENLKTTKYNDGTKIPLVTADTSWLKLTTPGYCWYKDTSTNKDTYGALYNWYAVNTGKLCPSGWHVPKDSDWSVLIKFLDKNAKPDSFPESGIAGGKLKETGTAHWLSPNMGATNETGFTALPGGLRDANWKIAFSFGFTLSSGYWWSSTEFDANNAWLRYMDFNLSYVCRSKNSKLNGFSVRCVKD